MSIEKKIIELDDEDLKKVSGGDDEKKPKYNLYDVYTARKGLFSLQGIIEEIYEELIDGVQFYKVYASYYRKGSELVQSKCYLKVSEDEISNSVYIDQNSDRRIY